MNLLSDFGGNDEDGQERFGMKKYIVTLTQIDHLKRRFVEEGIDVALNGKREGSRIYH